MIVNDPLVLTTRNCTYFSARFCYPWIVVERCERSGPTLIWLGVRVTDTRWCHPLTMYAWAGKSNFVTWWVIVTWIIPFELPAHPESESVETLTLWRHRTEMSLFEVFSFYVCVYFEFFQLLPLDFPWKTPMPIDAPLDYFIKKFRPSNTEFFWT